MMSHLYYISKLVFFNHEVHNKMVEFSKQENMILLSSQERHFLLEGSLPSIILDFLE